jgi:hypothetical protein
MIALIVTLLLANIVATPLVWFLEAAYLFAMNKPWDFNKFIAVQQFKFDNILWSVVPKYAEWNAELCFMMYLLGDLMCGLILAGLFAVFGYFMLIPVVCFTILSYLRYLNKEQKDA